MWRSCTVVMTLIASALVVTYQASAGPFRRHRQCQNNCYQATVTCPSQIAALNPIAEEPRSASKTVNSLAEADSASVPVLPEAVPTRKLYFTYPFGANGPERHNMWNVEQEAWIEELPTGEKERFTVVGRWTEFASKGILARKDSNPDLFIFLPDADQPIKQVLFRMADKSDWASLGEITELYAGEQK